MKITALDAFPIREPQSRRAYTLLKISTDTRGATGWGETHSISPASLARARSLLIGQEPSRYDVLTRHFAGDPLSAALNMALLDLAGQEAKAPVFQLLGGPTRFKVRALTALSSPNQRDALLAQGHRAFLIPIALPTAITSRPNIVSSIATQFANLRRSSGDNVDFVPDGQALLPSAEASDLAVALEPFHPLWFDRPTRDPNTEVLARITSESTCPLGLGHDFSTIAPVQNLLREGVVDILRLSLNTHGITPLRRAAAIAETYYTAIAPHHTGGPVATAAALHLAASLPNFFIQEIPATPDPEDRRLRDSLVGGPLENPTDGYLKLSTQPGLGITIDESTLRRLAA